MNDLFSEMLEQHAPKMNPDVMNGVACRYMPRAEEYLREVFKSVEKSFPEGLKFEGCERCTPEEEFEFATKIQNNKRSVDIAQSYLFLMKVYKTYMGEPLPVQYIYLPYLDSNNIFKLGGVAYHITPVLSDNVISPGNDHIFVRLLKDKIMFKRCYHAFCVSGTRETGYVLYSEIHRKKPTGTKVPPTTKANTSISHYLFAKFGVSETFRRALGYVPVFGEDEITYENYPRDKWIICSGSGSKPKTFLGEFYKPTSIKIAFPIEKWTPEARSLAAQFYYVIDHFPSRMKALDTTTAEGMKNQELYLDNVNLWKVLLGHIIFSGHHGENMLYTQICEHYASLDNYMDTIVIDKLAEIGFQINDFYDLLMMLMVNFNTMIVQSEHNSMSVYGMSLEVLYYILYGVVHGLNVTSFKLNKLASDTRRPLTARKIAETFARQMRPGIIHSLKDGKVICEPVAYSGDHKYPKITSVITEQAKAVGASRGRSARQKVGLDQHLEPSMAEAGSVLFLSKSNPTPMRHINPYVKLDPRTCTILQNPEHKETLDYVRSMYVVGK